MDFAKKELEKYGWVEGEGLGKNRSGISKPVKPKYKFDTVGLGRNIAEEFTNDWWRKAYDEAANSIVTKKSNDGMVIELKSDSDDHVKKKKKRKKSDINDSNGVKYGGFIKTSELKDSTEKRLALNDSDDEASAKKSKYEYKHISDEELFKICGGRTCHRTARHGLDLSYKLGKIAEEAKKSKNIKESNIDCDNVDGVKVKKKKKHKKKCE